MRKSFIEKDHPQLSIRKQAELLNVNRHRLIPQVRSSRSDEHEVCLALDKLHHLRPYFGSRRLWRELSSQGHLVGRGRVRRLMRKMGIVACYPKPRTSQKAPGHKVYPYLLRDLQIARPNQVWCSDITYIPMRRGFAYLVVIMDWHSRAVLGWRISNTLDTSFCMEALKDARDVAGCWPEIMNTDQGCQYTSKEWTGALKDAGVKISMDGKRRWIDNVMVERFWRSLKYEDIYLREYRDLLQLEKGVRTWIDFYNHERRHQSLDYRTPWSIWTMGATQEAA